MKFLLGAYLMTMLNTLLLLVSDAGWIAITSISASFFSLVGLVVVALINKKVNTVKESIDGLLEQKSKADKALGVVEGIETALKEKAIGDARELQTIKEQKLRDEVPAKSLDTNSDVKNLEMEIRKKGDEIQKVVEKKGDEIHEGVKEIPPLVVEEIKKQPPK